MTFQSHNFGEGEPTSPRDMKFKGWLVEGSDGIYRPQKRIQYYAGRIVDILQKRFLGK